MDWNAFLLKKIFIPVFSALLCLLVVFPVFSADYYWETPYELTKTDSRFPSVASNGDVSYIFWQDIEKNSETIYLSCRFQDKNGSWTENRRFAGPFSYSGDVPDMYSAAVSKTGAVAVAVLDRTNSITILVSDDGGVSFRSSAVPGQNQLFVAPKMYASSSGGFILFASSSKGTAYSSRYSETDFSGGAFSELQFYLNCAVSDDGVTWSGFSEFMPSSNLKNPFAPFLCSAGKDDFVVFQAQYQSGMRISYQLYASYSSNGGRWSEPVMITGANSVSSSDDFTMYQNQRPNVFCFENNVYVAWERRLRYSDSDSIWISRIGRNGLVPGSAEETASKGNSRRAVLFENGGKLSFTWFDTRSGVEAVYMASKNGILWEEHKLSSGKGANMFSFPVFIHEEGANNPDRKLGFVWQKNSGMTKDVPSVNFLSPDISVLPPEISAAKIKNGARSGNRKIRFKITLPHDSSEVAGYVYVWSQDKDGKPVMSEENLLLPRDTVLNLSAATEGMWYLTACAYDYAGNWSEPSTFSFYYDQTPPAAVLLNSLPVDNAGFMDSNSFSVGWLPSDADDDIAGYTYSLKYIAPLDGAYSSTPNLPSEKSDSEKKAYVQTVLDRYARQFETELKLPEKIQLVRPELYFRNYPNGIYVLSVAAVDTVGFVGAQTELPLILNKYVPHAVITKVETSVSRTGDVSAVMTGNDFLYDGEVSGIIIDRNGRKPFDYEITSGFKVKSNTQITGIRLPDDMEEGSYFIGIEHSARGLYVSPKAVLTIEKSGTIKIDNMYEYVPGYYAVQNKIKYYIDMGTVLFVLTLALAFVFLVYFSSAIVKNVREVFTVRELLYSTSRGISMDIALSAGSGGSQKKTVGASSGRRGSLLYEIIGFTFALIIIIVVGAAVPLYKYRISDTEKTLSSGLKERVDVLLSSLSSGAKAYMPTNNILDLSLLPEQITAIPEAQFATITGLSSDEPQRTSGAGEDTILHVWASNDPDILSKIDTPELTLGTSLITTDLAKEFNDICRSLNERVSETAGGSAEQIRLLNSEGAALGLRTDSKSVNRLHEVTQESQRLTVKLNMEFDRFARDGSGSVPEFDTLRLNRSETSYLFYRPVIFRMSSSEDFVRGIVFVRISTESLLKAVDDAKHRIIIIVSVTAGFILVLGAAGSVLIGRHLASPIITLEKFVQKITDEKHKENLAGERKDIKIVRNDEIGRLGDAMNRLKEELAYAAIEEKLTNDGKAVQKAFLPLDKAENASGQKTTASYSDRNIEAFGYYEGASAVSGDYFDYKKLDDRWYVFIKSDASGHGTPAGLIMTVVATLFCKFFEKWSFRSSGTNITSLVYQINDFLESLGLKGKFATIILVLFDSETGKMYICNAGDNLVHVYESEKSSLNTISLKETPAAGPFPAFMIDMKGGFVQEEATLAHKDILFLYTDGIEEATRLVRNSDYQVIQEEVNGKIEDAKELLEADRVKQVIEAVFARSEFVLEKLNNPDETERFVFDFTSCGGTSDEAVVALAAVEKVFRMYKPHYVTAGDSIKVDRKIDSFLKKHFNLYEKYCNIDSSFEKEDENSEYIHYNFVMEDDQADDLTLLAIRRP